MTRTISSSLKYLEQGIVESFADIEAWLRAKNAICPPLFYCSTDLRNNGYKIAPIDTNLFPGGFNNLSSSSYPLASAAISRQIADICPAAKSILLIPENHTRNLLYLENVATISHLFELAGINVRIGRLNGDTTPIVTASGHELPVFEIQRRNNCLYCDDFQPCAVVLNNDLSAGLPSLLADLDIPVMPMTQLGWSQRKKSDHFYQYNLVAEEFSTLLNIDPWLLTPDFSVCRSVNFQQREGMECLAIAVDETLALIREKYEEHDIDDSPFVVIKANAGTYGMGVIRVEKSDEVFHLNRKQRNNMSVGKEGLAVTDVIIQEGIRTSDVFNSATAEPVIYMIGETVVGGFYRINATRSDSENLNSRGMSFSPLPFETNCTPPPVAMANDDATARLYVYSVIGRLAAIAAAYEQNTIKTSNNTL